MINETILVADDEANIRETVNGRRVEMRAREFDLLLALVNHKNRVLSRQQLLDLVWGYEFYGATRAVDVHATCLCFVLNLPYYVKQFAQPLVAFPFLEIRDCHLNGYKFGY